MNLDVEKTIHTVLEEWGDSPKHVNSGECDPFAMEVLERLDSEDVWAMYTWELPEEKVLKDTPGSSPEPIHTWITDGTHHYDAECPEGVERWQELPIFTRFGYI